MLDRGRGDVIASGGGAGTAAGAGLHIGDRTGQLKGAEAIDGEHSAVVAVHSELLGATHTAHGFVDEIFNGAVGGGVLDLLGSEACRQRQLHSDGLAVEHIVGDGNFLALLSAIDLDGGNGRCLKGHGSSSQISLGDIDIDLDLGLDHVLSRKLFLCHIGSLGDSGLFVIADRRGHAFNVGLVLDGFDLDLISGLDGVPHSRIGRSRNDDRSVVLGAHLHSEGVAAITGVLNMMSVRDMGAGVGGEQAVGHDGLALGIIALDTLGDIQGVLAGGALEGAGGDVKLIAIHKGIDRTILIDSMTDIDCISVSAGESAAVDVDINGAIIVIGAGNNQRRANFLCTVVIRIGGAE